jgi:hypothetical protein
MTPVTHPDKQQVRDWLKRQVVERKSPQTPDEIRRELGWYFLPNNKDAQCAR